MSSHLTITLIISVFTLIGGSFYFVDGAALGGRGYGGYESYYNYGSSGWREGPGRRPLGHFPVGGYRNLKGPGWRGNYGGYGGGHGGYGGYGGGYGPGYGGYGHPGPIGGGSVSSASASASSGGGGLFGGASNSHASSETASFNLGPLSATFSKANANANSLG